MKKLTSDEYNVLIAKSLSGNQAAFTRLYNHYYEFCKICCVKYVGFDSEYLDDVVNMTFAKVFEFVKTGKCDRMGVFGKIVQRAAQQVCWVQHLYTTAKIRKGYVVNIDEYRYLADGKNENPLNRMIQQESIQQAIAKIRSHCANKNQLAAIDGFLEGMTVEEIADSIGRTANCIYKARQQVVAKSGIRILRRSRYKTVENQ